MSDEPRFVTHLDPVWRERTNYIVHLDLTEYGLPGTCEQYWARTSDHEHFEVCCIPFFTYGHSLGDTLRVDLETGAHTVMQRAGHHTVRLAFTDDRQAHEKHELLHGAIIEAHCLLELRQGGHYGAIAIDHPSKTEASSTSSMITTRLATSSGNGQIHQSTPDKGAHRRRGCSGVVSEVGAAVP